MTCRLLQTSAGTYIFSKFCVAKPQTYGTPKTTVLLKEAVLLRVPFLELPVQWLVDLVSGEDIARRSRVLLLGINL